MSSEQRQDIRILDNSKTDQEIVMRKLIFLRDNAPPELRARYDQALQRFAKVRGIPYQSVIEVSGPRRFFDNFLESVRKGINFRK